MKNNWFTKRVLPVVLMLALLVPLAVFPVEASNSVSYYQVENSAFDAQKWNLSAKKPDGTSYVDTDMVRVSVVLEGKSTIEAGFSTLGIAQNEAAMAYRDGLKVNQVNVTSSIEKAIGSDLDVVRNLTLAANIISANVQYGDIAKIEKVSGVKEVVIETQYAPAVASVSEKVDPDMSTSGAQIGSTAAWANGYTGAGSLVAIIDTGIDSDHELFDAEAFEYSLSLLDNMPVLLTAEDVAAVADELNVVIDPEKTYLSSKVPYAYNYVDDDYQVTHDTDSQGEHGSHVTGIAAGNKYVKSGDGFVASLDSVMTQGVAPDAQIVTMKVFGKGGGAYDSDYMIAIEDAMILGCDSVNLSLGAGYAGMTTSATYQYILDEISESDTVVVMSAGNSYNWAENSYNLIGYLYGDDVSYATSGTPGIYSSGLNVASVDNDGTTGNYFEVGGEKVFYSETSGYGNSPFTTIAGAQEYVFIDGAGTDEQFAAVADVLAGKVAVCYRGTTSFYQKANAAVANGAIATIIVNNQPGVININLTGYEYSAPAVSVLQSVGELMWNDETAAEVEGLAYCTGSLEVATEIGSGSFDSEYYTMSDFSSWGVPGSLIMKPEITAPGGNIYSVNGAIAGGQAYENMSGTSMASPQVAGMVAVVGQYIRESGLAEKTGLSPRTLALSLLMSTSVPLIEEDSGSYYSILKQGSGLANVGYAVSAESFILMGEGAGASAADGKVKVELGDDPDKLGMYTFSFSINNITDKDMYYALSADMFTQDLFAYYLNSEGSAIGYYLDTWTAPVDSYAIWQVEGTESFSGDVQAVLDYVSGAASELENMAAYDLDGNGKITSYDAYLLAILNEDGEAVRVPANDSLDVTVTLCLTDAQIAIFDNYYENGAYIEAYVNVDALSDGEGVQGVSHSIPVLGFYGNWTSASMYDREDAISYYHGTATTDTYLGNAFSNGAIVTYADAPTTGYYFAGNPIATDSEYHPERNAVAYGNGSKLAGFEYTLIRTAAAGRITITDTTANEVVYEATYGSQIGAYYYVNGGSWQSTYYSKDIGWDGADAVEGHSYVATLTMAPQYYVDAEGNVDWDALGDGASYSVPFVVDNTAPEMLGMTFNDNALTIMAKDNQYIAGILVYDSNGELVDSATADDSPSGGKVLTMVLNTEELEGVYNVEIYDYALNCTTYRAFVNCEPTYDVEDVTISASSAKVFVGNTVALSAVASPETLMDTGVVWSSSDNSVATVSANGVVTGVSKGTAVITATAVLDASKSASCEVVVDTVAVTLYGALQDEYGTPLLFTWDMENDSSWTAYAEIGCDISSTAYDWLAYNALFVQDSSGSGTMYAFDPSTGESLGSTGSGNAFGAAMWDMDFAFYNNSVNGTDTVFGVYGAYLLQSEVLENTFSTGWNLGSYLSDYSGASRFVAVTWGGIDSSKKDCLYALDNAGTVWILRYNGTSSIGLGYIPTDLNLTFPTYGETQYCSLVFDDNLDKLYLSYFTGSTNDIYLLEFDGSKFVSNKIGSVGADVWPCSLFMAAPNDSEEASAESRTEIAAVATENMTVVAENIMAESVKASDLDASVSVKPVADINSTSSFVANVYAEEDAITNGKVVVSYSGNLELANYEVTSEFYSVCFDPENGTVTIAFVETEAYAEGDLIATLNFNKVSSGATTITTQFLEVNKEVVCAECADLVKVEAVEPTCTESGNVEYYYCPECGTYYLDAEGTVKTTLTEVTVPALGHDGEIVNAKEATCTEAGYTGDLVCKVCGELIEKGSVILAKGHDYESVVTDPTCTEAGYTTYTCKVCGESFVSDYVNALGHNYVAVVTDPTCTEKGYTTYTCSTCGDSFIDDYVDALGHDYEAVVTEPTCTERGYTTHTCKVCGDSYVDSYVDALGHAYGDPVVTSEPTLGKEGVSEKTCAHCGDVIKTAIPVISAQPSDKVALPEGAVVIDFAGYKHAAYVSIVAGDNMSISELTALGHERHEAKDMNYAYVVIVDKDNVVVKVLTELGVSKANEVCPEGGYIISYNGNKAGYDVIKNIYVGDVITLYNIDLDAMRGVADNQALTDAGFTAAHTHTYVDGVCTECGEEDPDYVPYEIGDVNRDGVVDAMDYILLKRALINGEEEDNFGGAFDDEQMKLADVNGDGDVDSADYVTLKRLILEAKEN